MGGGSTPVVGQQLMANSSPVVIASDQTAVPVSAVDLGLKAEAAASTDAGTFSLIALFKRLLGKMPALGTATSANASPVVIASDQAAVPVSQSGSWSVGLLTGTQVIGHVITDSGSTTAVTGTVTVAGTVTANAGTNLNTSLLALESGGNLASIKTNTDSLVSGMTVADFSLALRNTLVNALNHQIASENNGGRLRVVLDAAPGAQTLGTVTTVTGVTTVATVTNVSNLVAVGPASAGIPIRDAQVTPLERDVWANAVRRLIT